MIGRDRLEYKGNCERFADHVWLRVYLNKEYNPSLRRNREYGLRFFAAGKEFRLLQISGSCRRIRLREGKRQWWAKLPQNVRWEVYETTEGQTYETPAEAETVARNLTRH